MVNPWPQFSGVWEVNWALSIFARAFEWEPVAWQYLQIRQPNNDAWKITNILVQTWGGWTICYKLCSAASRNLSTCFYQLSSLYCMSGVRSVARMAWCGTRLSLCREFSIKYAELNIFSEVVSTLLWPNLRCPLVVVFVIAEQHGKEVKSDALGTSFQLHVKVGYIRSVSDAPLHSIFKGLCSNTNVWFAARISEQDNTKHSMN